MGCGLTRGHRHGAPQAGEGLDQQPQHRQAVLRGSWTPSTSFGKGSLRLPLVWTGGWPPPSCFHVSAPGAPRAPFIPLTQEVGTGLCAAARSVLSLWGPRTRGQFNSASSGRGWKRGARAGEEVRARGPLPEWVPLGGTLGGQRGGREGSEGC